MNTSRKLKLACLWLCLCLLVAPGAALGQEGSTPDAKTENPRLDSTTNQLLAAYRSGGLTAAQDFAALHGLTLSGDRVQVTVLAALADPDVEAIKAAITHENGSLQSWWGAQVQALAPLGSLERLAADPAVRFIRQPLRGVPDVVSEGDAAINADSFRLSVGANGTGVKVAVLDSGFQGYPGLITQGELPASAIVQSFRADGVSDGVTVHGAACAEIVYDLVPGAQLYLVNYETDTEFLNAVDYLEQQGVRVVSHSISWFDAGPYDGTSIISARIDTARQNGILWSNSAGNRGAQHWEGNFQNNGSGYHVWSGSDIYNRVAAQVLSTVTAYLSWNDWPAATSDYDLELLRYSSGSWTVVASSTTRQDGSQPPVEEINFQTTQSGTYGLRVKKYSGSDKYLELFTTRQDLNYKVAAGSIPNAGDSAGAMTVGAVASDLYTSGTLEAFSSRGPTNATGGGAPDYNNGSRIKPDLISPDYVSTATYGALGFSGTSASSPHAAGAAALYASGYLKIFGSLPTPAQIQTYLENCAETTYDWGTDINGTIKNNDFGAGGMFLCQSPTDLRLESLAARPASPAPAAVAALALTLAAGGGLLIARRRRPAK